MSRIIKRFMGVWTKIFVVILIGIGAFLTFTQAADWKGRIALLSESNNGTLQDHGTPNELSRAKCETKVQLHRCNADFENDKKWIWRRIYSYSVDAITTPGCSATTFKYKWLLGDSETGEFIKAFPKYEDKPILTLKPFELDIGTFVLQVEVTEVKEGGKVGKANSQCLLTVQPTKPQAVILGGISRVVPSDQSFRLEGNRSLNLDLKPGEAGFLYFMWSCRASPTNPFCPNKIISDLNHLEVPSSEAKTGTEFKFKLEVSSDTQVWVTTTQTVTVKKGAYHMFVRCVKNCGTKVNSKLVTFLQAECKTCPDQIYTWSMTPGSNNKKKSINFEEETVYGKNNPKLIILEEVLYPSDSYTFTAESMDGKAKASALINVSKPPKADCKCNPSSGKSLTTIFNITCKDVQHPEPVYYKLSQSTPSQTLLEVNDVGAFSLYLPASPENNTWFAVKIIDVDGLFTVGRINIQVDHFLSDTPATDKMDKLEQVYQGNDNRYPSVKSLIKRGKTDAAIQLITVLIAEAGNISRTTTGYEEFQRKLKRALLTDLQMIPAESQNALLQVSAALRNLVELNAEEMDLEFLSPAAKFCKEMAKTQVKHMFGSPTIDVLSFDTKNLSRNILACVTKFLKENPKDLVPDVVINITTPSSYLSVSLFTENYPDYTDADIKTVLKLNKYKEMTTTAVETSILMGLSVALTMAPGEPIKTITSPSSKMLLLTDEAQQIPNRRIEAYDSYVQGSPSLAQGGSIAINVVVIAYPETPHWWDPQATQLAGPVLNVNFFAGKERIKKLKEPMKIGIRVNESQPFIINGSVSVPTNLSSWTIRNLEDCMMIHRLNVQQGTSFVVRFLRLSDNAVVQVVITYNLRPTGHDFIKPMIVKKDNPSITSNFPKKLLGHGDAWAYVAVLPNKSMIENSSEAKFTFNYEIAFKSLWCVHWKQSSKTWTSTGCLIGQNTTSTDLQCLCHHRSAFGAFHANTTSLTDKVTTVKFTLSLQTCYVVFISVCVIFGLYCLALVFGVKRIRREKSSRPDVYFLSDNTQSDCFAYLVIVKTGLKPTAGTTSNISLKIFGQKSDSKEHVINYPDPYKKLLQRGCDDWFILTTEYHMGEINYIYLWHDSVGLRPSWYCEWISIWDLQTNDNWFFEVQAWFSVIKGELPRIAVEPIHRQKKKFNIFDSIREKHLWNIFSPKNTSLRYLERITIVLSTVLTTYVFTMVLYGIPLMRLRDGLGYGHYEIRPIIILIACLSSIMSFIINLGLVKLFKRSAQNSYLEKKASGLNHPQLPWILTVSVIVISLVILVVFGFWVPYVTSLLWVTSTIGALLQSIILLENAYILATTFINNEEGRIIKFPIDIPQIITDTEEQRKNLYPIFGQTLLRPYFTKKYQPLTRQEWRVKREKELIRSSFATLVQDLAMFSIYIVLLYYVVQANKDPLDVYSHNEMQDMVYGVHTQTMKFEDIENLDDFYEYVNATLIPNLHAMNWYGNFNVLDPGLMTDFNTKVLGVARIRQLRVCEDCCEHNAFAKLFNMACIPEFTRRYNDEGEYMEYWKPKEVILVPRLISAWKYHDDAAPSLGDVTIYPGGGYNGTLGRTMHNAYYDLKYYQDTKWIDERTRAIFIDFLAYNANYNIFHAVKLLIERSASGLFIKKSRIRTTRLLLAKFQLGKMIAIIFLAFIASIVLMFIKNLYVAQKYRRNYFRDKWNIVDIFIILMSFSCVGLFIHRSNLVGKLLAELERTRHNEFINYFNLIYMEEVFTVLASVLIGIATIRLWKLLRFGVIFRIMEKTLVLSVRYLFGVFMCHVNILLMYGIFGYLLYGPYSSDFRNLHVTITTLVLLSLGLYPDFDFGLFLDSYSVIGYAYYISYMMVTMTIFTLYIAVIVLSYEEGCKFFSNVKKYYTVVRYLKEEFRYLLELLRKRININRLEGGADPETAEEIQEKIYVMSLIARCAVLTLRENKTPLTDDDVELMRETAFQVTGDQDKPEPKVTYFTTTDKDRKTVLISDDRLLQMEYVVNAMLNDEKRNRKEREEEEKVQAIKADCEAQLHYIERTLKLMLRIFKNIRVTVEEA